LERQLQSHLAHARVLRAGDTAKRSRANVRNGRVRVVEVSVVKHVEELRPPLHMDAFRERYVLVNGHVEQLEAGADDAAARGVAKESGCGLRVCTSREPLLDSLRISNRADDIRTGCESLAADAQGRS